MNGLGLSHEDASLIGFNPRQLKAPRNSLATDLAVYMEIFSFGRMHSTGPEQMQKESQGGNRITRVHLKMAIKACLCMCVQYADWPLQIIGNPWDELRLNWTWSSL